MNRFFCAAWLTLMGLGCAHAKPEETKAPPPTEPVAAAKSDAPAPAAVASCSADTQCRDGQLCIRGSCVDISIGLAECQMFRVHFSFNAYDVDPDARNDLARMARCLRADQALHLNIEGNADERGTEEYNLQLGSKRASSVEKYLIALGVSQAQLKTVSYGENKPLCTEQDEACWAKNRRASVKPSEAPQARKK